MRLSAARQAEYTEYYRGEMKKYQAENERLRDEIAQQDELRRMEAEALVGAAKEAERLLRAENKRLHEDIRTLGLAVQILNPTSVFTDSFAAQVAEVMARHGR